MSGQVVGLDIPALLGMAEVLGYDRRIIAQLLPFAEAGVVEGIREREDDE